MADVAVIPGSLRERTQEINGEYWDARKSQGERVAVVQLCLALARTEAERDARCPLSGDEVAQIRGLLEYSARLESVGNAQWRRVTAALSLLDSEDAG